MQIATPLCANPRGHGACRFEERLALLVDREAIGRENKRLGSRLKFAGPRQAAIVEDTDMKVARGLDKTLFAKLVAGDCITRHQNLAIIGKTGLGKVGSPAPSVTRPAATIAPCSIIASQGCSMPWRWLAAMAGMHGC